MTEYDEIAEWYAAARSADVGVREVIRLADTLPSRADVLDLGCGNGLPIARALDDRGFAVFGIDSSREMVRRFRKNLPHVPVACEAAQRSDFFGRSFDAVICWGVMFHLDPEDQARIIEKVARHLNPGGFFLFTSGEREGVVEGEMNGVSFRYVSLGAAEYRRLLEGAGLQPTEERFDPADNYVYIARKPLPKG